MSENGWVRPISNPHEFLNLLGYMWEPWREDFNVATELVWNDHRHLTRNDLEVSGQLRQDLVRQIVELVKYLEEQDAERTALEARRKVEEKVEALHRAEAAEQASKRRRWFGKPKSPRVVISDETKLLMSPPVPGHGFTPDDIGVVSFPPPAFKTPSPAWLAYFAGATESMYHAQMDLWEEVWYSIDHTVETLLHSYEARQDVRDALADSDFSEDLLLLMNEDRPF